LASIHRIDNVNKLPVHFSPGDLLFAEDDIETVGAIADIQLAYDALKIMIGARRLTATRRKQAARILPVLHPVITEMVQISKFDIRRDLVVHLDFEQVLELEKTKIFVAVENPLVFRQQDIRPLAVKPLKG